MKYFYIDTSSTFLYLAVIENDRIINHYEMMLNNDLSTYTITKVDELFKSCGLTPNDVDKIIVVNGPGSFTGIRIGVTIAKTIAWTLKKDITTISSLDAMSKVITSAKYIVPIIDARRGYVYAGIYDKENSVIMNGEYISLDSLKKKLKGLDNDYTIISNDNIKCELAIQKFEPNYLNIIKNYGSKENINAHIVEPEYLKLTEAEENRSDKNDN